MQTLLHRERGHAPPHGQKVDESLLERIRGEYDEMPGLSLTPAQAARLWHLDHDTCRTALTRLVQRRVLTMTPRGRYVKHD